MANTGLIVGGIIIMILGAGGTIFALPFVEQTACSGQGLFGSLAQLNEKNQKINYIEEQNLHELVLQNFPMGI